MYGTAEAVAPAEATPRPDRLYALKVLRRQWGMAAAVAVGTFAAGLAASLWVKDVHRSAIVASFDRRDALTLGSDALASINAEGVEAAFEARMADPQFIGEIVTQAGIDTEGRLKRALRGIGWLGEEEEADRDARLLGWASTRLVPLVQYGTGTLTLNVYLDGGGARAQALAALTMEAFIQRELKNASERLSMKLEFLAEALAKARERLKDLQNDSGAAAATARTAKTDKPAAPGADLRQREAELLDRIRLAEGSVADMADERVRRRTLLEADYQSLAARLSPTHPELLAKRAELQAAARTADPVDGAARELSRLRRELWKTRSEMLYPGAGESVAGGFVSLEERLEAARIADLASRMEELELEKSNIDRQASDASLRSSLKVVKPATLETKPFAKKRQQGVLATVALALTLGALTIVWRELRNPLARDAWRIVASTGRPVLAQLSAASVERYPRISPATADDLRSRLATTRGKSDLAVRTLLAYRRLELSLARHCRGRVVCVASAGAADRTRDFFFSFANVVTTDSGRLLVVDANALDPLSSNDTAPAPRADLLDVLDGKAPWRDAVRPASEERAFDLLTIASAVSGARTRAFRSEALGRLFAELAEAYPLVLVRSLPEAQFIENVAVIGSVTDLFVAVDAQRTTRDELARTLIHLGRDKLRGLVLVGS